MQTTTALLSTANTVQTEDTIVSTLDQLDRSVCCECMDAATPSNGIDKVIGCQKDPQCEAFVCDFDDYCCTVLWDKTCSYYASEKCTETNVVISTTQTLQAVAETDEAWNIDIIWKVSLAVFGVMAACIMGCCAMLYFVKCFCKKNTLQTMDFETNSAAKQQTNVLPTDGTSNEAAEAEMDDLNQTVDRKRGKSMDDHLHVRVAVNEEEEDEDGDALQTVSKKKRRKRVLTKRRKKMKIDDDEEDDENVNSLHPLFDRKCRSNSF